MKESILLPLLLLLATTKPATAQGGAGSCRTTTSTQSISCPTPSSCTPVYTGGCTDNEYQQDSTQTFCNSEGKTTTCGYSVICCTPQSNNNNNNNNNGGGGRVGGGGMMVPQSSSSTTTNNNGGTCGNGNRGNGICPKQDECCSEHGYCGSTSEHCGGSSSSTSQATSSSDWWDPNTSSSSSTRYNDIKGRFCIRYFLLVSYFARPLIFCPSAFFRQS